jgi:hypothetical protein
LAVDDDLLRLKNHNQHHKETCMPVLEAQALKTDPKGSAFLHDVLCVERQTKVVPLRAVRLREERANLVRQRLEWLQSAAVS